MKLKLKHSLKIESKLIYKRLMHSKLSPTQLLNTCLKLKEKQCFVKSMKTKRNKRKMRKIRKRNIEKKLPFYIKMKRMPKKNKKRKRKLKTKNNLINMLKTLLSSLIIVTLMELLISKNIMSI